MTKTFKKCFWHADSSHVSMAVTYSRHMNLGLPPISNDDIGIQTNMLLINIFDILGWNFQSSVANQDYWQKMPRRADAGFFTCSLALKRTRSKRHKSCYLGILNWRSIAKVTWSKSRSPRAYCTVGLVHVVRHTCSADACDLFRWDPVCCPCQSGCHPMTPTSMCFCLTIFAEGHQVAKINWWFCADQWQKHASMNWGMHPAEVWSAESPRRTSRFLPICDQESTVPEDLWCLHASLAVDLFWLLCLQCCTNLFLRHLC